MYAVEFETSINNGVFRIPERFRQLHSVAKAKIIIMVEDDAASAVPASLGFIERLANNPLRLGKTLRFLSREEANER